jgi:transcription elongation factor GreA
MSKILTKEGFDKLNSKLQKYLKKRAIIAKKIEEAKALGDLSENADYAKSKEEQAFNEGRIREAENILSNAEIIKTANNNGAVGMNSIVRIKDERAKEYEYRIVGSGEADPLLGKISYESPLGHRFLGKKINEIVEIETPGGKKTYKIVKIN